MSEFAFAERQGGRKKTPGLRFFSFPLQISIYEPFNILSDKMLIVPLGILDDM